MRLLDGTGRALLGGGNPNPFLFLAPLGGTLAFQDRSGGGTLTGSGAVRYQAASGARTNLIRNPRAATNTNGWGYYAGAGAASPGSIASDATQGIFGSAIKASFTDLDAADPGFLVSNGYYGATAGHQIREVVVGTTYRVQVWAWTDVPGQISLQVNTVSSDLSGGNISTHATVSPVTLTASSPSSPQLFSATHEVGSGKSIEYPQLLFRSAGGDDIAGNVWLYAIMTVDTGANIDYFDGTTGAWLDPITGILGTAHASPSVSQAAAWVEEGTTNAIPDPSFEAATITTNWAVVGASAISKVTTHAYVGSNGGKVVCTASASDGISQLSTTGAAASNGQSWTLSARVRALAAGDVGKKCRLIISERTSADALVVETAGSDVTLTDAWQSVSYTSVLAGGGTVAKVTAKILNGAGSPAAVDFVLDAVQLEQKAYATSYCDGAIGTGYAWSGTAHASSSTRTKCDISVTKTSHINSDRGAIASRFTRNYDSASSAYVMSVGNQNSVGADWVGFHILQGSPDVLTCRVSHSNTGIVNGPASGSASSLNTWFAGFGEWTSASVGSAVGTDLIASVAVANAPVGWGSSSDIAIGSSAFALHINGLIGPVAIFDRPLTDRERTRINALSTLDWRSLDAA